MGVSVGLQSFRNKEIAKFPRSIVWDIFGPKANWIAGAWDLTYNGWRGGVLFLDDDELIDWCSVERPSEGAIRDLFKVAQRVPVAISEDANFFVIDESIVAGMPDFLLDALPKPPRVVRSAEELLERLAGR
jgi:hypothetical protein